MTPVEKRIDMIVALPALDARDVVLSVVADGKATAFRISRNAAVSAVTRIVEALATQQQ